MKRFLTCILKAILLLSGCGTSAERIREPVTFYYMRENPETLRHGEDLFVGEVREAAGHRQDLSYLMVLYLIGPSTEGLRLPIPKGTRIVDITMEGETVLLTMPDTEKTMTDIEYALACTCLSQTCLELTDAESVTITSGERSITMDRSTLVLTDRTHTNETEANQ